MSSSNNELKFNKLLEENEKHKNNFKIAKQEEKVSFMRMTIESICGARAKEYH